MIMTTSLITRLMHISKDLGPIPKNGYNPHFKSNYPLYGDILKTLKPLLQKHKVHVYHYVQSSYLVTEVVNADEPTDYIKSGIPLDEELLKNPQKLGGALTYYKRYNTVALFDLDTEVDDDGNTSAGLAQGNSTGTDSQSRSKAKTSSPAGSPAKGTSELPFC